MSANPPLFQPEQLLRLQRWRLLKDKLARHGIAVGGLGVIFAIVLIFFYLFYVVFPLFIPASVERQEGYTLPGGGGASLHLALDELNELGVRYTETGEAVYFRVADGEVVERYQTAIGKVATLDTEGVIGRLTALADERGQALLVHHGFRVTYPDDVRTVLPRFEYPYGEKPLTVDDEGSVLRLLELRDGEERMTIAAMTADERLLLNTFAKESSFLNEDEVTLERSVTQLEGVDIDVQFLLVDPGQRHLYAAAANGELLHYDISDPDEIHLIERLHLLAEGTRLTSLKFLLGGYALLAGGSDGSVTQWFPVRDAHNVSTLQSIRSFHDQDAAVVDIAPEHRRKGFLVADGKGRVGIYHATAQRTVLIENVADEPLSLVVISPRGDYMLAEGESGRMYRYRIHNQHPEISWHSLWEKVHYEGYAEAEYIWQSSSADNDFEPKFSLTPLSFGTLKAAFYAMLFAVPLAILGAIYTAYFMAPGMRTIVKPTIEIMEALPTVILGFLAGLWLAPFIESYLPGIFALLLLLPLGVLAFSYFWQQLPRQIRMLVPEGWEAVLMIPVILFLVWLSIALSIPLEQVLFGGDMRAWLYNDLGIGFDQRNSLVVGLAMGFAVIPTIFSITEDAIFGVPKHLTFGSLALGASRWQTLSRVVILTASPGIFSAVMIGLGRAVGETMIVLMATGNTPVMDMNIFQGMRTLSANIAVEMPESEVASTHYRVLFLAALVLFMFTFVFNTLAELIRHRLRKKYSSL